MLETGKSRTEISSVRIRGVRQPKLSENWRRNFQVGSIPSEIEEAEHLAIRGTAFQCSGKGLTGVLVMVFLFDGNGRRSLVGKAITTAKGEYLIFPILHPGQSMTCCFFRDGFEPQFRTVEPADLGGNAEINAILPSARAMAMQILNGTGAPVDGVQLTIASSATDPFPITYVSDPSGMVFTQAVLRVGREYWIRVLTGDLELHAQWLETPKPVRISDGESIEKFSATIRIK